MAARPCTATSTLHEAVCCWSLLKRTMTGSLPTGTPAATSRLTLALSPATPAALKLARLMPATAGELKMAAFTTPSISEARSTALPPLPTAKARLAGQLVMIWCTTGPPQALRGEAVLRGVTLPLAKSKPLSSVSLQPPFARRIASVFDGAGATLPSKPLAVPKPTRSMTAAPVGLTTVCAVLLLLNNTLPAVPDMARLPEASGVGKSCVPPAPLACCTSKYWPACKSIAGKAVTAQLLPVAEAYCTLQLLRFTGLAPRLNNSMKSLRYSAPALPPPPYT